LQSIGKAKSQTVAEADSSEIMSVQQSFGKEILEESEHQKRKNLGLADMMIGGTAPSQNDNSESFFDDIDMVNLNVKEKKPFRKQSRSLIDVTEDHSDSNGSAKSERVKKD
jgi:hypothetical protein